MSDSPGANEAPDEKVLVGVRTDQSQYHVSGTRHGYRCFKCNCGVSLAVAGQSYVSHNPETKVCCMECAFQSNPDSVELAPGAIEELVADAKRRVKRHQEN